MSSNKTWLVAQREYLENVRTKTFWIGILIVPVLIMVSIGIQKWLAKAKDTRKYAVIDYTEDQWLSKAIQKRADASSALSVFEGFQFSNPKDPELVLQEFKSQLEKKTAHPLHDLASIASDTLLRQVAAVAVLVSQKQARAELEAGLATLPGAVHDQLERALGGVKTRFKLVTYPNLGDRAEGALAEKLASGELFAYFVLGKDPFAVGAEDNKYVSNNLTDKDLEKWYSQLATDIVRDRRVEKLGLTAAQARTLQLEFDFRGVSVTSTGAEKKVAKSDVARKWAPVAFVYLLWIAVFTAAQMLLTNTIEEKSNRLIEVLLSSISPMQLMAGKVIGIGITGLTIVGFWVLCAWVGLKYGMSLMGGGAVDLDLVKVVTDPLLLFSFIAYFLGGYLLYAAVLVGIGSVCNSLKEAQNLMQPVFICLMVPLLAMVFVTQDPNGTLARGLTYVPMFTPFLMMNRAGGPPETWEYFASTAVIVVSIGIAFWGAAKIFRIGILMTGKPPRLGEILGWLKAPVGTVATIKDGARPPGST